ncbi:helix-turn-helix domain-containing protein [Burkholderia vietnamiensis]|uniref:MarR family transcriptional regulator n=1 Tax=Burkholderia vietnamiensis TaxID=60552 RepID=UPI0015932139|nr:helix-turn-helix domain-containing protein [Burkholderia vietnamiensis]WHU92684.1 helix-turn-helix domain-containing protein [Burkholderia vietnamiensis]
MTLHFFDIDDVPEYGLPGAILLQNLRYWIAHNHANGTHFIDGRTWTYNSAAAYRTQFPYLSEDTIQRTLKKLVDKGVLLRRGNPNDGRDRTGWYAFVDEETHLTKVMATRLHSAKSRKAFRKSAESIPYQCGMHAAKARDIYTETNVNTNVSTESLWSERSGAVRARKSNSRSWWESASGIEAQGRRMGVKRAVSEPLPIYLVRVAKVSGCGPWIEHVLERAQRDGTEHLQNVAQFLGDDLLPSGWTVK